VVFGNGGGGVCGLEVSRGSTIGEFCLGHSTLKIFDRSLEN